MTNWNRKPIFNLATTYAGGTPNRAVSQYFGGGIPWVKSTELNRASIEDTEEKLTELGLKNSSAKYVPANNPLMAMYGATAGVVSWLSIKATTNQAVLAIIPQENVCDARWLYWSLAFNRENILSTIQGSGQLNLSKGNIDSFCISFPLNVSEQKTIATILDTIDEAIAAAEAQLAKQEKIKQGLLQDLLTRGIDETGQIRSHWKDRPDLYQKTELGVIPKDWGVQDLDSMASLITSGSRNWADYYSNVGAFFIRIGNLTRENINLRFDSIVYVDLPTNKEGQRTRLSPGDILVSITADLGIVAVIPDDIGEAYINQHIALVRLNLSKVNSRFVGYFLASETVQNYITKLNDVGAKAGLNLSAIRGLLTVVPNIEEQNLIVSYLDDAVNQTFDSKLEIKKLQKIKTGLMQDLLTGQRRVTPELIRQVETLTGSA